MDDGENIQLELTASRVTPLCWHPGRLVISPLRVYFLPFNVVSSAPLLTYVASCALSPPLFLSPFSSLPQKT